MVLRFLDRVAAELVPHDGEHSVPKRIGDSGANALEQREGDHRARNIGSDSLSNHPSSFAGICYLRTDPVQRGVLTERFSSQVQKPGTNDTAVAPRFRDLPQVESEFLFLLLFSPRPSWKLRELRVEPLRLPPCPPEAGWQSVSSTPCHAIIA